MVIDLNSTVDCACAAHDIAASTTAYARASLAHRRCAISSSAQFGGALGRTVALHHGLGLGIVGVLQHRALAEPLTADDDRHRAGGAALLGVNGAWRHQIDLALRAGRDRSEPHLGITGPAAVVDAFVTLEALRSVEHPVEHPGVGVIVPAAGSSRPAH